MKINHYTSPNPNRVVKYRIHMRRAGVWCFCEFLPATTDRPYKIHVRTFGEYTTYAGAHRAYLNQIS